MHYTQGESMQKFFEFIKRLNSLLLFGVFASVLALMIMAFWSPYQDGTEDVIGISATGLSGERVRFHLDEIANIQGADTQMIFLVSTTTSPGLAYSDRRSEKRNALFIAADDKTARWLFPSQSNVIHQYWPLAQSPGWPAENVLAEERQVLALAFAYSARDSTGDGEITEDDRIDRALTRPDGNSLVTVLSDVDRVFRIGLINRELVSVLYQASGSVRNARYAVDSFRKVVDEEIVNIPKQASTR